MVSLLKILSIGLFFSQVTTQDPLLTAIRSRDTQQVQKAIAAGCNVHGNGSSWTPLHEATLAGEKEIVALLLGYGANPNVRDTTFGAAPLYWAADGGDPDIIDLLLRHKASINALSKYGVSALHQAALRGHTAAVGLLLKHGAEYSETTINMAHAANRPEVVALLEQVQDGRT